MPAQFGTPLAHVTHLGAVFRWTVERHVFQFPIADGNTEAIPERLQTRQIQLFQRMGFIAGFPGLTGAITLDGHGQDYGRTLGLLTGCGIGCIHLIGIMASSIEVHDFFITQALNQLQSLGVFAEKVFSGIGTTIELEILQFTVADLIHTALQQPRRVPFQQRIPFSAPDYFYDVPTSAPK